jgi:hypothetical protein
MKHAATLTLIAPALVLAACSGSTPSAEIDVARPGEDVLAPCQGPVRIYAEAVTQLDQERLWAADRRNLVICQRKHAAAVAWIKGISDALD